MMQSTTWLLGTATVARTACCSLTSIAVRRALNRQASRPATCIRQSSALRQPLRQPFVGCKSQLRALHNTAVRLREAKVYSYDEVPLPWRSLFKYHEATDMQLHKDQAVERSTIRGTRIDVRELSEYEAGHIPSALNIPISSQPDALLLDPVDFETRFGFPKPDVNKEVVFYCKAGVRSKAAAKIAESGGYEYVGEYPGSWMDWVKNGGSSEKP